MERVRFAMPVISVDDRPIGLVLALHSCCFEVSGEGRIVAITRAALAGVDEAGRVHLVCSKERVDLYACPFHSMRPIP